MRDAYDKATKQPSEFVERMARHKSKSIISWTEAREKNDFSIFRDDLATMIDLVRELAELLGYENEKYDALLDLYESGLTVARLDPLFAGLRDSSVPLIQSVNQSGDNSNNWVYDHEWPVEGQQKLSHALSEAVGFDFQAGRRDESNSPILWRF